jgi:hypothetical protein
MRFIILSIFSLNFSSAQEVGYIPADPKWNEVWSTQQLSSADLLKLLDLSPTAKELKFRALSKAASLGAVLHEVISGGQVSVTDSSVVRKYGAQDPLRVEYTIQQKIYLNKSLTLQEAYLDLVHELVHYTFRVAINPYEKNYSAQDFIKHTIEGVGGEAQAVYTECKVAKELFGDMMWKRSPCLYGLLNGELVMSQIIKGFYLVGQQDYEKIHQYFSAKSGRSIALDQAISHMPYLSSSSAVFISSAYGSSYPLAAIEEHQKIKKRVCLNEVKRASVMREHFSEYVGAQKMKISQMLASLDNSCSHTLED